MPHLNTPGILIRAERKRLGLTQDELNTLIKDGEKYKKADELNLKFIELKNEAKGVIIRIEKLLVEKKLEKDFAGEIEDVIININKAIDAKQNENIKKYTKVLKDFYNELLIIDNNIDNNIDNSVAKS